MKQKIISQPLRKRVWVNFLLLVSILLYSVNIFSSTQNYPPDLSEIFNNQLLIDTNNDEIPDDISVRFYIDGDTPTPDIEAAAAIAARLGFESCGMPNSLVVSSWKEVKTKNIKWLILFSNSNVKSAQQMKPTNTSKYKNPTPQSNHCDKAYGEEKYNCGIKIYKKEGIHIIDIFGENSQARKYAAIHFFSRFPYIWDITGRETGELWTYLKKDIRSILPDSVKNKYSIRISSIYYKYKNPLPKGMKKRIQQRMGISATIHQKGEVDRVIVEILPLKSLESFRDESIIKIFKDKLLKLKNDHQRGKNTNILNFAAIKSIEIHLSSPKHTQGETLINFPRIDLPQRFLNLVSDPNYFEKKITVPDMNSDISEFYTSLGIYKDTDNDGFSDRMISNVIYDGKLPQNMITLASRMGLENCAISLPFISHASKFEMKNIKNLERPLFIGANNPWIRYLRKVGKASAPILGKDEGILQFSSGFNPGGAFIISGSNQTGENAVLQYIATILPYISSNHTQPGDFLWKDVTKELDQFFKRKNDAGKAAWSILQMDKQREKFAAPDLLEASLKLFTLKHIKNLIPFLEKRIQSYGQKPPNPQPIKKEILKITTGGRLEPKMGFSDKFSPQWEADEAREIFKKDILPLIKETLHSQNFLKDSNSKLKIDLRLSEPLEVLRALSKELENLASNAGIEKEILKIRIITAYKQGFHWIKDYLIPRLRNKSSEISSIVIRFSPFDLNLQENRKYWPETVRWLQELYPIDEIIEKELDIPLKFIQMVKDDQLGKDIYKFIVFNQKKEIIFEESFTPFTKKINFQERYKQWGEVVVCTGGIKLEVKEKEVFFKTIDTDPLRLWLHYQSKILPRLTEMIEKQKGGPLKMEDQPFFHQLKVTVKMSEPDYRLKLDEEMISSLESFHEDIYFNTLDYFKSLVKKDPDTDMKNPIMAGRWAAPGNILPIVHSSHKGGRPSMETQVTLLESLKSKTSLNLKYKEIKEPLKIDRDISVPKEMNSPRLTALVMGPQLNVKEAEYTLELKNEEELSDAIDMLNILKELKEEKILPQTLNYPGIEGIRFVLKAPPQLQAHLVLNFKTSISNDFLKKTANQKPLTMDDLESKLQRILSPKETLEICHQLGTLPEIDDYTGGHSFQGREVPVLEIGLQSGGKIQSKQKMITFKPTVFILGRQHANEVSSTNYSLKMAGLLAKDPGYRKYLKQLNIVIEPMENPDGSALIEKLLELTPHHMLHAGRYSALGTDIGYQVYKPDTLITEAMVRKKIYDTWKPDIFLNNHGYPSHEWVQQFSNYTPYLFRAYWIPRGWYYFHIGFNRIQSPYHKQAGDRIVQLISNNMKKDPEIFNTNKRIYDRYHRWAERWQPHLHYLEMYNGTNIYKKRRHSTETRLSQRRKMTVLEAIPEAMDETAHGNWLDLAIRQGILFIKAYLDLALESKKPIERIEEEINDQVHLQLIRHHPLRVNHSKKEMN